MGKAPAYQHYPNDFSRDCQSLSLAARGAWIEILGAMWFSPSRGQLTMSMTAWARLLRTSEKEADEAIRELMVNAICDFHESSNSLITLMSRRMVREEGQRTSGAKRTARFREKGGGDPERWNAIRVKILERDDYMCQYCGKKAVTSLMKT